MPSIKWFFFNAKNHENLTHPLTVSAPRSDLSLGELDWIDALKAYFDFNVKMSTLRFWRWDEMGANWLKDHQEIDKFANRCQSVELVDKIIGDASEVHVFITADELQEDTVQKPTEEEDRLSELLVPWMHSGESWVRERAKLQGDIGTAIYDGYFKPGRPVETIAPPIQIFHPVFQQFSDRINDPTFEPDEATIVSVSKLMSATMELFSSEIEAFNKLHPLLSDLVGKDMVQIPSKGSRTSGTLVRKQIGNTDVPLVRVEYKLALNDGNRDPSVQAAYSVREYLVLEEFEDIFEKCCCPCFLLSGGGAYLSVLGVVFPYKFVVQRLTDAMWIGVATPQEEGRLYRLARVFYALRPAVAALDDYYDQISKDEQIPKLVDNKPHPRLFPYPTEFEEYTPNSSETAQSSPIRFKYINLPSTADTNVTFIAKVESQNRKLVVKFVERYGVEAHDLLASKGMAPRLLYCGHPDGKHDVRSDESRAQGSIKTGGLYVGPIQMVIMEYIKGTTLDARKNPPKDTHAEIQQAIGILHESGFVFGDLRAPNIMISEDKPYLIDFDWSGREGEARYPLHLSKNVDWPEEPLQLELKLILKDHDLIMLDKLFGSPVGR